MNTPLIYHAPTDCRQANNLRGFGVFHRPLDIDFQGIEANADGKTPKDTRTEAQRAALIKLVAELKASYPSATVHGHNEFAAKACPSFNVQKEPELCGR